MVTIAENSKQILEQIVGMQPDKRILLVVEPFARCKAIAQIIYDVATSMGAQAVLAMTEPRPNIGQEPPECIAAAMKNVDAVIEVAEKTHIAHTTAMHEAHTSRGTRFYGWHTDVPEDYLAIPFSSDTLAALKQRTEKVAAIESRASVARVTTPFGTDLAFSLEGRQAIPLHPLAPHNMAFNPQYAESTIAPVEGTTEGVLVVDANVRGWGNVLHEPIRFEVRKGRVLPETIKSDIPEQAERLRRLVLLDEGAANCAGELGMGTNTTISKSLRGDIQFDFATAGTVHIALGRNNGIGGNISSAVHCDLLMTKATVQLDNELCIVENGELKM